MKKLMFLFAAMAVILAAARLSLRSLGHPQSELDEIAAVIEDQAKASPETAALKKRAPSSAAKSDKPNPATAITESKLEDFKSASRLQWTEKRDPQTGALISLRNGSISLPGGDSIRMAREFVARYARGIFGVAPESLEFLEVRKVTREKVIFQQRLRGLEIYGAQLTMIFEGGELVQVSSQLIPNPEFSAAIPEDALARARARFHVSSDLRLGLKTTERLTAKPLDTGDSRLVFYPGVNGLTLAAIFEAVEDGPKGGSASYIILEVDSGEVIRRLPASFN